MVEIRKLVICPHQYQCANDDCPHFHPHPQLDTCEEVYCEEYGKVGKCEEVRPA